MKNEHEATRAVEIIMAAIQSIHEKIDRLEDAQLEIINIFENAARNLRR